MRKVGYARVSTDLQITDRQIDALTNAGCEIIYEDRISGSRKKRPQLDKMLSELQPGDCVYVMKIDRLGRSLIHLLTLVEEFKARGIHFVSISDNFDTSNPSGVFFFHILAAVAELEKGLIQERTKSGLASAKRRGIQLGRRKDPVKEQEAKRLIGEGKGQDEIMAILGVKKSRYYELIAN